MINDEIESDEIKGIESASYAKQGIDTPYAKSLPRGYISVSQINQMAKCGEAYYRRYVLEQKIPSTTFAAQGRAVHRAAETLHNSLIGKAPISLEQMEQVYSDTHDAEVADAVVIDDEDAVNPGQLKDVGIKLTRKYHTAALGQGTDSVTGKPLEPIVPIAAERVFRTYLKTEHTDPVPFMGVVDVETEDCVVDLKTKRKLAPQSEADNSIQLALYAHVLGKPHVRLDQLIKPTKTSGVRFTRTSSIVKKSDALHAVDIAVQTAEDIAAARFRKAPMDAWWCTEKWCPYWKDCRGKNR